MKKRLVLIAVVIMAIIAVTMIYQTYAASSTVSSNNNIHSITLSGTSEINVPADSSKTVIYQITNTNKGIVQYGVAYKGDNITVKAYNTSEDKAIGTVDYGENKFVKLYIKNSGTSSRTITLQAVLGYENGGDLIVPSGYNLVTEVYNLSGISQYITNLYLENKNKVVTNNSIEYQYAESVNLMNDRLGGTTSDYDDGNVRYYGANPDNYIDIGDRDSEGNVIPYRIIGVFKDMELSDGTHEDLVKVIRADSIGYYAWDNKTSGIGSSVNDAGSNDWSDSRLMMLLNPGYAQYNESNPFEDASANIIYGYEGSLWWNSKGGTCYAGYSSNATKTCDFTSTGLSRNVQNKIEEVVWPLGGMPEDNIYSNSYYEYERGEEVYTGRPTEWSGRVALIYPSDYGYGTDFNSCKATLYGYTTSECYNNNWLYISDEIQWLLTPSSDDSYDVFGIRSDGSVYSVYYDVDDIVWVRPTFYLKAGTTIVGGSGTSEDPYEIDYKETLVEHITDLYMNNKNKVVTNNSIEYQYAESVNLMNDRLGGTASDYDAGNIRYYGANPNNYVDIGDRTSDGKVIPYRIIGLFKDMELANGTTDDLIKVIRADSIGNYSWDNKTDGIGHTNGDGGSNDWSLSRLMMLLNPGYDKYSTSNPFKDISENIIYGYEGSLWWNSKSGTCYADYMNATIDCDFTSIGLSRNAQSKIETVVWNLGGNANGEIYSDDYYMYERGTLIHNSVSMWKWPGKIALMYPSDYGYATNFNACSSTLLNYLEDGCYNSDWLFNGTNQWLLTPNGYYPFLINHVSEEGYVYSEGELPDIFAVRPTFYLNSELVIESGDGSSGSPYVLG